MILWSKPQLQKPAWWYFPLGYHLSSPSLSDPSESEDCDESESAMISPSSSYLQTGITPQQKKTNYKIYIVVRNKKTCLRGRRNCQGDIDLVRMTKTCERKCQKMMIYRRTKISKIEVAGTRPPKMANKYGQGLVSQNRIMSTMSRSEKFYLIKWS